MDQAYNLPAPQPNPDVVDMHQAVNNANLLAVAQALQTAVDDRQHANEVDLSNVAARLYKSVSAQQRYNSTQLKPVVQQLLGTVDAAQAANASALAQLPPSVQMIVTRQQEAANAAQAQPTPTIQVLGVQQPQQPATTQQTAATSGNWYCVVDKINGDSVQQMSPETAAALSAQLSATGGFVSGPFDSPSIPGCNPLPTTPPPPTVVPITQPPIQPLPPQPPTDGQPPVTVTPPPPTDTEPPPVDTTTTLLQILAGDTSCVGGDFCARMLSARTLLIRLGYQLTDDANQVLDYEFWDKVVSVWKDENDFVSNFKMSARTLIKRVQASSLPTLYDNSLRHCLGEGVPDVIALQALKNAVQWLDSISESVSASGTDGRSVSMSAGANVLIVSGNLSGTSGSSHSFSDSQSIKLIVVPLIQLIDFFIKWRVPTKPLSAGEATSQYTMGFLDEPHLRCYVEMAGYDYDAYSSIVTSQFWHPSAIDTERLWRIGFYDDFQRRKMLEWNRIKDDYTTETLSQLYQNYPGVNDVLRFMVRDVFDRTVVEAAGLDLEFTEKWTDIAKRLGHIAGVSDEIAKYHWAAHWVLPSTSQVYEMFHRLREGRVADKLVFTRKDAIKLLAVNDNAPGYRDRLIAISYRPLPIRALRSLYDTTQIDALEVGERYQDMGYSPDDAALFSKQEEFLKIRRMASQGQGFTPNWLSKAYAVSVIGAPFLRQEMQRLGYDKDTSDRMIQRAELDRTIQFGKAGERRAMALAQQATLSAYQAGAIDRDQALSVFQSQGISIRASVALLDAQDLRSRTQLTLQAVAAIRKAVLSGVLSFPQARLQLTQAGVNEPRLSEYVATWTLLLSPKRRTLSRNEILKLVREGILTSEQARQRLYNLGFAVDDTELMLLEVAYQAQQSELRSKTALDKQRQKTAAALLRETERIKTLGEKTRKALCQKTGPGVLQRWYAGHVIDDQYVVESLTCQGYTPDQTSKYLETFKAARYERDQKKATIPEEASSATTTNGSGGSGSGSTTS